jgi:hypothetical protein
MTHWERAGQYERLRAEYNAAFARLRAEESRLRASGKQGPVDAIAEGAMAAYRECREKLARFLISIRPSGESEASVDLQTVSGWMTGRERRAPDSAEGTGGFEAEVQALAYRLWEEAGRPIGSPQEHWYRAEQLCRALERPSAGTRTVRKRASEVRVGLLRRGLAMPSPYDANATS